jgi:hypothetical protein
LSHKRALLKSLMGADRFDRVKGDEEVIGIVADLDRKSEAVN